MTVLADARSRGPDRRWAGPVPVPLSEIPLMSGGGTLWASSGGVAPAPRSGVVRGGLAVKKLPTFHHQSDVLHHVAEEKVSDRWDWLVMHSGPVRFLEGGSNLRSPLP